MYKISNGIEALGFGKWFQDNVDPVDLESFDIARVIAVHKDSYILNNGEKDVFAELTGKLLFSAASPIDFPAVGDWVLATFYEKGTFSIIHNVLPRKSLLKRKTPGNKIDFQLIAANIDVAFIVQSLDTNFNIRRLERYLVMVKDNNIVAALPGQFPALVKNFFYVAFATRCGIDLCSSFTQPFKAFPAHFFR